MAYKLLYNSAISKDLKKISKNETRKILNEIETILLNNPLIYPMLKGEFKGYRKFRVGNYRVIYRVNKDEVFVLKIGDRKKVYK